MIFLEERKARFVKEVYFKEVKSYLKHSFGMGDAAHY